MSDQREDEGIYVFEGATRERIEGNTVSGGVRELDPDLGCLGSSAVVECQYRPREFSDFGIQVGSGATAEIADNEVDRRQMGHCS